MSSSRTQPDVISSKPLRNVSTSLYSLEMYDERYRLIPVPFLLTHVSKTRIWHCEQQVTWTLPPLVMTMTVIAKASTGLHTSETSIHAVIHIHHAIVLTDNFSTGDQKLIITHCMSCLTAKLSDLMYLHYLHLKSMQSNADSTYHVPWRSNSHLPTLPVPDIPSFC